MSRSLPLDCSSRRRLSHRRSSRRFSENPARIKCHSETRKKQRDIFFIALGIVARRSSLVASLFIACSSLVAQTMISSGQKKKIPSLEAEDDIDMENMELLFKDSSDFTCIAPVVGSSRSVAAAGPSSAAAAANPGIFTVTRPSSIPTAAGPSNTAAAAGPSSTTAAAGSSSTAATAGPSSTAAAAGLVDLARRGRGTKAGKHRKAKTFFQFLFHMSDTYSNHYYGGERGRGRGDGRGRGRGRGDGGRGRGRGRSQGD
ncbi:uncharacterized protein LOC143902154 [Temnothorax americanus]|uniref:uncharacterized protein LOC143902154 n=1 Tax=Temnothorax americanus TaxID=1964332 RepID=UPI004069678F